MIEVKKLAPQIIALHLHDELTHDKWLNYQELVSSLLNNSPIKLYILSDFNDVSSFDSHFAEIEAISYLTYPQLGFNSLVCQSGVMNFLLKLSETRLQKQGNPLPIGIYKSYDSALEALQQECEAETKSPKERLLLKSRMSSSII